LAEHVVHVGVREFREGLAEYLTRHGQTVGYYVPARRAVDSEEPAALRRAADQLQRLLAEYGSARTRSRVTSAPAVAGSRALVLGRRAKPEAPAALKCPRRYRILGRRRQARLTKGRRCAGA